MNDKTLDQIMMSAGVIVVICATIVCVVATIWLAGALAHAVWQGVVA